MSASLKDRDFTVSEKELLKQMGGEPIAEDERNMLFNKEILDADKKLLTEELQKIEDEAVRIRNLPEGATRTMSDGTVYEVTDQGWRKIHDKKK